MTRTHPRITVAVALALATVAAMIALVAAFVAPASGTPPSGVTAELLGRGTVANDFAIRVDGIRVSAKGPVDFVTEHLTFAPGGTTGWHVHPGPALIIVTSGTVTKYSADCTANRYSTGQAFVENGPTDVNMVRNETNTTAEDVVTFITPVGAAPRDDVPAPPDCNP
jgi:quercetin dioxygenase-like cupin family protein